MAIMVTEKAAKAVKKTGRTPVAVWARRRVLGLPDGRANWAGRRSRRRSSRSANNGRKVQWFVFDPG